MRHGSGYAGKGYLVDPKVLSLRAAKRKADEEYMNLEYAFKPPCVYEVIIVRKVCTAKKPKNWRKLVDKMYWDSYEGEVS